MIRKADTNDIERLARLASDLHPPWNKAMLSSVLESENADVLVYGEDVTAFVCIEYALDEGCITAVITDKTARRRGIAEKLIRFAENLRQTRNIYLEVNETNAAAIALYVKCGYKQVGKRKNYYGNDAAIIMDKEF